MSIASTLNTTLADHGVKALLKKTWRGPSVSLYGYQLEGGQSVRSVTGIAQDLAVAVGQESVRILAPIPGTSWVGIEVPNEARCTVDYEPETSDWQGEGILPIPVGVDVKSHVIEADLTSLPHLLIAGSTGSGKSVALNTIITALIARNTPETLRLHLIDPKRVELKHFADAPQVESVVTNLDDAEDLLSDLVGEMDRRYEQFEHAGVRNIGEFNSDHPDIALPYQVVVVDEMADLMMQRKREVEPLIVRLAQLARAAGIHLILATQRPTVDVITGLIKTNIPSRLAFAVASVKDSMVILDQPGAQALIGKGDGLFLPMGQMRPDRVQGLWTSNSRIASVITEALVDGEIEPSINLGAVDDDEEIEEAEGPGEAEEAEGPTEELPSDPQDEDARILAQMSRVWALPEPEPQPKVSKLENARSIANTLIAFGFLVTFIVLVVGIVF